MITIPAEWRDAGFRHFALYINGGALKIAEIETSHNGTATWRVGFNVGDPVAKGSGASFTVALAAVESFLGVRGLPKALEPK